MTLIPLQTLNEQGADLTLTLADLANGNEVPNNEGETILMFSNIGISSGTCTVTIVCQKLTFNNPAYGLGKKESVTLSFGVDDIKTAGKFAKIPFNNASGNIELTYTGDVTGLYVSAVRGSL